MSQDFVTPPRNDEGAVFHRGITPSRAVSGVVAVLLAIMWGIFLHSSFQQWNLARDAAASNTLTLAKLVEAWALSTLERLDYLAVAVEFQRNEGEDGSELATLIRKQQAAAPDLFTVIDVLDSAGRRIATSAHDIDAEQGRNFDSDREQTTQSIIGLPRAVGDRTLIPILHPLFARGGERSGAVVVEIDPNYFAGFSADLGLPPDASVELYRADGPLLARNLAALGTVGQSYPNTPLWAALGRAPTGWFDAVLMDGVGRVVSYRTSQKFPLVVAIGFSTDQLFSESRRRIIGNGLVGLVLTLVLIVAAWSLLVVLRQRAIAERRAAVAGAAVESVGNGVAVLETGKPQRIVFANPAFSRLLRYSNRDPIGCPLADLIGQDAFDRLWFSDNTDTRLDDSTHEVPLWRDAAGEKWMEIHLAPIRDNLGLARHNVIVMTDITERKRSEADLVQAKEDADSANRAKSDFLANMSHELRTPLNAVIGFADIIAQQLFGPVGSERYREYATFIHMSGTHLLEVISDILDLAKVEANRVVLEEDKIQIPAVLKICTTLVAGRAEQAGVKVQVSAVPDLPVLIADELRVKQIVLNLLSNAVKFSPSDAEVRLSAQMMETGELAIVIADRGCGMTQREVELALEPFGQVNSAIAKGKEGTGLGLPLARRLTEIHGGRLEIESVPGQGTTARVVFPALRTSPWPAEAQNAASVA